MARQNALSTSLRILLLSYSTLSAADPLPYNPTHLFFSSHNSSNLLYSLQPVSPDHPHGRLQSLQVGRAVTADSLSYTTISSTLPFLDDASLSYTPSLDPDGGISVYTGTCSAGANSSQLWRFAPAPQEQGTWTERALSFSATSSRGSSQIGPNFLASSISFSPTTHESETSVYIFGGMCPNAASTPSNWQSAASYSNQMLVFQPGADQSIDYTLVPSTGAPIAEAGFTITPLLPAISNSSTGITSQQQSFLLMGGHTQTAFINMSQVAVFSLPQASWVFLPVQQPSHVMIEPRSGHTTLLSSDGSKAILLGGWVGTTSNIAEPQMAVLDVGEGYGGTSAWRWSPVDLSASPFASGSGIYGHGAVMLPGNVMMVAGGYNIAAAKSKERRDEHSINSKTYFYNMTSNAWIGTYPGVNSQMLNGMTQADTMSGPLATSSQKAGLGAGLPLGIAAVGAALFLAYLYWRRTTKKRLAMRDRQLRERDVYTHHAAATQPRDMEDDPFDDSHHSTEMTSVIPPLPPPSAVMREYHSNHQPSWDDVKDAERTGLDLNVPSPQRGLRKGRYYASPTDKRSSRNSAAMPVFDEREEDEALSPMLPEGHDEDPFRDHQPHPLRINTDARAMSIESRSRPMSPQEERQREMETWVHGWESASQTLHSPQTPSPTKSEDNGFVRRQALAYDYMDQNKSKKLVSGSLKRARSPQKPHHIRDGSLASLQQESEALLGKPDIAIDPDTTPTFTQEPTNRRASSRIGSWVGSVRRNVLGGSSGPSWRSASASATSTPMRPHGGLVDIAVEPYRDDPQPSIAGSSSPTRDEWRASSPVKRSVSAGDAYWAVKKGARDWGAGEGEQGLRERQGSTEWDPEDAIRDRVVQLMFTVPRGELRVVNADVGLDGASEGEGEDEAAGRSPRMWDGTPSNEVALRGRGTF